MSIEPKQRSLNQWLASATVLLVEDDPLIAMDAEDVLIALGTAKVVSAYDTTEALRRVEEEVPTLAMLDINLRGETSFSVASQLITMGIPFIFVSGYGTNFNLPKEHSSAIVIGKPFSPQTVAEALTAVLSQTT